jgi:hypothetical protein
MQQQQAIMLSLLSTSGGYDLPVSACAFMGTQT